MKITDVKVYLAREWRTFCFVVVETDEGISGIGEAGITGRELAVQGAIDHFRPLLIGQDPFRTEHIWQLLFRGGFFPAQRILTAAIAAIDIALWDIKGKALGVPVYELLGGRVRDRVLTYNHNGGDTVEELVECCQRSLEEGWKVLRWGLGHEPDGLLEPDVEVRRAIREFEALRLALGGDVKLALDVHTRLNPADALWLCQEAEQHRPYFIEDPLRVENSQSYRQLRARTTVPLAAGEQYSSKWEFRQVIEEELIDYARIDLCICGGLSEAKKIAAMCETHYIDLAVHNPIGPVATVAFLHLCLSVPNCAVQELPRRPGESLPDLVLNQPEWEDGYLLPPTAPGLGIEFNAEALGKFPFSMGELKHLRRADGSFTNW
ncbi:MAG: mandelate racemase/muconate lactonizing enzyme family protein [Anaerolineae bacterium]|nr:mandelate racemase/muconate lactonizing enzyme family protein [Anaerolineae bacterium]